MSGMLFKKLCSCSRLSPVKLETINIGTILEIQEGSYVSNYM